MNVADFRSRKPVRRWTLEAYGLNAEADLRPSRHNCRRLKPAKPLQVNTREHGENAGGRGANRQQQESGSWRRRNWQAGITIIIIIGSSISSSNSISTWRAKPRSFDLHHTLPWRTGHHCSSLKPAVRLSSYIGTFTGRMPHRGTVSLHEPRHLCFCLHCRVQLSAAGAGVPGLTALPCRCRHCARRPSNVAFSSCLQGCKLVAQVSSCSAMRTE